MKRVTAAGAVLVTAALLTLLLVHGDGSGTASGAPTAQLPTARDRFEPDLGLPAEDVVAFGASSAGALWAYGVLGPAPVQVNGTSYSDQYVLLSRSSASSAWQIVPLPEAEGKPLAPADAEDAGPAAYGELAGQVTGAGGVVLLSGKSIVVRDPGEGQSGSQVAATGKAGSRGEPLPLEEGEALLPPTPTGSSTVPYAAMEEQGGSTGVLIAPYDDGGKPGPSGEIELEAGVLHYDGQRWTREKIEVGAEERQHFIALAMSCAGTQTVPSASAPEDCWLLAGYGAGVQPEHLALFRRVKASSPSGWVWKPQPTTGWLLGHEALPAGVHTVSVESLPQGAQMLTATSQGVWVDFQARVNGQQSATDVSQLVLDPSEEAGTQAKVAGTWCYPTVEKVCEDTLGAAFPSSYRSFAWAGSSPAELGTRVVTGLEYGAMLEFANGTFTYEIGDGGEPTGGGAALYRSSGSAAVEGVVSYGKRGSNAGADEEGQSPVVTLTSSPKEDELDEEAVPFRQPLLAVAQAPGTAPGDPEGEALAVGLNGEIGRYVPGQGWQPEALLNSERRALTGSKYDLRGVAWPEPKRAYAVGDEGNMWMWMQETGYWVPDPAKPFNFEGNLNAIAFEPGNPQVGFAVGKQGALLKYGKSWEELSKQTVKKEAKRLEGELGLEEWRLNFTSIAFAGSEALATYRYVTKEAGSSEEVEAGGLLVYNEEPSCVSEDEEVEREKHVHLSPGERPCWHVSASASSLIAGMRDLEATVLSKVAGLSDGGAVAAGPNIVMERESSSAPWQLASVPLVGAQNISALAAYRESSGKIRAVASIELDRHLNPNGAFVLDRGPYGGDVAVPSSAGEPPPLIPPDPIPDTGYVVKQTATGWEDMEHMALPVASKQSDLPIRPDPVFALLVSASGAQGLAVGGQTYDQGGFGAEEKGETSAAMRFPAASAHAQATPTEMSAPSGEASFVVGGEAQCQEGCANLANESIAPDVWLRHALQTAARIEGARAFLYIGKRTEADSASERESFEGLLGAAGSKLPVYVEPFTFGAVISYDGAEVELCEQCAPGTDAYSFTSTGTSGGAVKVIMLDYIHGTELGAPQREWLKAELKAAKPTEPAIVVGRDALDFNLPEEDGQVAPQATDAAAISQILVEGEASAYIFDYPSVNVQAQVTFGQQHVPTFGTGTLGPGEAGIGEEFKKDTLHSSAFLEISVDTAKRGKDPEAVGLPNRAPVEAQAVLNNGELAIRASEGSLLRRSYPALFEGLARRPLSGIEGGGDNGKEGIIVYPKAYDPIPTNCEGNNCPYEVPLQYTFTSSNPDIGAFVLHEAASHNATQVQLSSTRKPIPDEPRNSNHELTANGRFEERESSKGVMETVNENGEPVPRESSALFCAYNEGTTTITITAGGLSYSMPVHVQGGSAEEPCGTVPLKNPPPRIEPATEPISVPGLGQTPSSSPFTPQIQNLVPPAPAKIPVQAHSVPPTPAPLVPTQPASLYPDLLPPLPPAPALPQPTPPSGTAQVPAQSPVSQTVGATEREEEVEGAYQHVHNMAAYGGEKGSIPTWPIALIVVAAAAGAGLRPRRDREGTAYAWARIRRDGH